MNNISALALFILITLLIVGAVGKIYLELYKLWKKQGRNKKK